MLSELLAKLDLVKYAGVLERNGMTVASLMEMEADGKAAARLQSMGIFRGPREKIQGELRSRLPKPASGVTAELSGDRFNPDTPPALRKQRENRQLAAAAEAESRVVAAQAALGLSMEAAAPAPLPGGTPFTSNAPVPSTEFGSRGSSRRMSLQSVGARAVISSSSSSNTGLRGGGLGHVTQIISGSGGDPQLQHLAVEEQSLFGKVISDVSEFLGVGGVPPPGTIVPTRRASISDSIVARGGRKPLSGSQLAAAEAAVVKAAGTAAAASFVEDSPLWAPTLTGNERLEQLFASSKDELELQKICAKELNLCRGLVLPPSQGGSRTTQRPPVLVNADHQHIMTSHGRFLRLTMLVPGDSAAEAKVTGHRHRRSSLAAVSLGPSVGEFQLALNSNKREEWQQLSLLL